MVINPSTELENLLVSGVANSTPELLRLLVEKKIPFHKSKGKVRLDSSLQVLEEGQILKEVQVVISSSIPVRLEIYRDIESTNTQVLESLEPEEVYICLAERQRAGKGRRGRSWVSPFGRNIYLSIGRYIKVPISGLGGLSLVVGMQVVDVLRELGLEKVGLKWPNDILLDNGKLGGILVELKAKENRSVGVVIGVGINLAIGREEAKQIDQKWSDVGGSIDISRNILVGRLAARIVAALDEFESQGFSVFVDKWPDYNLYAGCLVDVIRGREQFSGLDRGIDHQGNLLIDTTHGPQLFNSGEVSLRIASQS